LSIFLEDFCPNGHDLAENFRQKPSGTKYCNTCHTEKERKYRKGKGSYNLTIEEYTDLLIAQDYKCAICKLPEQIENRNLSIDHDHVTGKVRGLLCNGCNTVLGMAKDNISILATAITYLTKE
jgi:hypothetical protein